MSLGPSTHAPAWSPFARRVGASGRDVRRLRRIEGTDLVLIPPCPIVNRSTSSSPPRRPFSLSPAGRRTTHLPRDPSRWTSAVAAASLESREVAPGARRRVEAAARSRADHRPEVRRRAAQERPRPEAGARRRAGARGSRARRLRGQRNKGAGGSPQAGSGGSLQGGGGQKAGPAGAAGSCDQTNNGKQSCGGTKCNVKCICKFNTITASTCTGQTCESFVGFCQDACSSGYVGYCFVGLLRGICGGAGSVASSRGRARWSALAAVRERGFVTLRTPHLRRTIARAAASRSSAHVAGSTW